MVFASLTYEDKEAFFSLLDEYFASRPGLLSSSSPPIRVTSPSRALHSPALPSPNAPTPPQSASSPSGLFSSFSRGRSDSQHSDTNVKPEKANMTQEQKDAAKEQQRMDLVTKFAIMGVKQGTSTARTTLGMVAGNKKAMNALGDIPGAQGLVRGADGLANPGKARNQKKSEGADGVGSDDLESQDVSGGTRKKAPPAPPEKKKGVSGLVSTKSFGHVDTSSRMGALTSMWKDPQKVQPPTANTSLPSASTRKSNPLPPPVRGAGSSGSVPRVTQTVVETTVMEAEGQAQIIYDYEGADAGDLSVQSGQIVNILEKTSVDWYTCEDGNGAKGLVPANYLKEI